MQVTHKAIQRGALIAGLALTVAPRLAWTQCEIFGPSEVCTGAPIQLCAPPDGIYTWTGPNSQTWSTQCIDVSAPGTYSVRFFDTNNGLWFGPCSQVVTAGSGPAASISGPTTGCDNQPASLCGPEGAFLYAWSGPNGFSADTRCVSVQSSGTYSLALSPAGGGCAGAPASHTLVLTSCAPAPSGDCPRPPSWWLRQHQGRSDARVAVSSMSDIGRCVDQRSAALDLSRAGSFQRTLSNRCDLRARAKRHLAAVFANVCAGEMGLVVLRGPAVRLSRSTQVTLPGVRTTVGEWLDRADQAVARLESRRMRDKDVRRQYAEIVRVGWHIDHGKGIGPCCVETVVEAPLAEDESPSQETADLGASLDLAVSPMSGAADVDFGVSSDNTVEDVSISVYDISGRRIAQLANGAYAPGDYRVRWSGATLSGRPASSGVYFIRGRMGEQMTENRVVIIK